MSLAVILAAGVAEATEAPSTGSPVTLTAPAGEAWRPDEPLVLQLSGLSTAERASLAFELDAVDVTAFARLEGERAVLELPVPLVPGLHTVRVLQVGADGRVSELASFPVQVREGKRSWEGSLGAHVAADLTQRVTDHHMAAPVERLALRGAGELHGSLAGDGWSLSANAPVIYDETAGVTGDPTRQDWDLGAYLAEGRTGPFSLRIGHLAPAESLVVQGFERRGLAAAVKLAPLHASVTAWSLRAEPITGFREGLGVGDHDRRVSGVTLESEPLPVPGGIVGLATTYLGGRSGPAGAQQGEAGAGSRRLEQGQAWSISANGSFLEERIHLNGEWARSRFDPYARLPGSAEPDQAWRVHLDVTPSRSWTLRELPVLLQLEGDYSEIGRRFVSVANPGAPTDQQSSRFHLTGSWAGLTAGASFGREWDNVDHVGYLPRFRTDRWEADLTWVPLRSAPPDTWLWRAIGSPYLQTSWSQDQTDLESRPSVDQVLLALSQTTVTVGGIVTSVFNGSALLDPTLGAIAANLFLDPFGPLPSLAFPEPRIRTLSFGGGSSYRWGNLGASHTIQWFDDAGGLQPSSRSDLTGANVAVRVGERASLALALQRQHDEFDSLDLRRTNWLGTASVTARLVPEVLDGTVSASLVRSRSSDSTVDSLSSVVSGRLGWQAIAPAGDRPGLGLALFGTWTDLDDDVSRSSSMGTFQLFVQATLDWSVQR